MSELPLPLAGIRVLDLGRIYLGPWAGAMFAHAGAEVVKVEEPIGEPARRGGREDMTVPVAMLNTGKRAITLDLRAERGRELLLALAREADVLIENFSPGTMDGLGVGPDVLLAANPRLVYGAGTGFGVDGPARDQLAMDVTVQAWTGVMSVTGFPDQPPVKAGPAFIDILGAANLYAGVVTALYERQRTGRGRVVDVAMADAVLPALASNVAGWRRGEPGRNGNRHAGSALAPYNVYAAADGWLTVIVVTDEHWRRMTEAMGRPELGTDARYATHADRVARLAEVDEVVETWSRALRRDEACELLRRAGVPAGPVREIEEVLDDEHLRVRGALVPTAQPGLSGPPVPVPRSALRFRDSPLPALSPAPRVGADDEAVYRSWLGLGDDELAALRAAGVIAPLRGGPPSR